MSWQWSVWPLQLHGRHKFCSLRKKPCPQTWDQTRFGYKKKLCPWWPYEKNILRCHVQFNPRIRNKRRFTVWCCQIDRLKLKPELLYLRERGKIPSSSCFYREKPASCLLFIHQILMIVWCQQRDPPQHTHTRCSLKTAGQQHPVFSLLSLVTSGPLCSSCATGSSVRDSPPDKQWDRWMDGPRIGSEAIKRFYTKRARSWFTASSVKHPVDWLPVYTGHKQSTFQLESEAGDVNRPSRKWMSRVELSCAWFCVVWGDVWRSFRGKDARDLEPFVTTFEGGLMCVCVRAPARMWQLQCPVEGEREGGAALQQLLLKKDVEASVLP